MKIAMKNGEGVILILTIIVVTINIEKLMKYEKQKMT
jgi:hypothetical protein